MAPHATTVNDVLSNAPHVKVKASDDYSSVYNDIYKMQTQQKSNPEQLRSLMSDLNVQLHQKGILQDVTIIGVDNDHHLIADRAGKRINLVASNISDSFVPKQGDTSFLKSAEHIGYDLAVGGWDELTHHPGKVAASAAIGFAAGAAGALVIPEIALAATVGGGLYAGYELYKHIPGWYHSAKVAANPGAYSANELKAADKQIEDFAAGAIDVGAGLAGGYAGSKFGAAVKAAWKGPEPVPEVSDQHINKANAGASQQQGDNGQSANAQPQGDNGHSAAAQPQGAQSGDGHHAAAAATSASQSPDAHHASAVAAQAGDPSSASNTKIETPAGRAALPVDETSVTTNSGTIEATAATPAMTLDSSIAANKAAFQAAVEKGAVSAMGKQDYNVMFQKVLENGTVESIENRGAGESVQAGHWIATQLNPDGTPNMVDGKLNQWPVTLKTILKSYKVSAEELESATKLVAGTKTDGPAVYMVQLDKPVHFKTAWGEIFGKVGDWLANYDFDPKTGHPGQDFNVIDGGVFNRTYEPIKTVPTV